MREEILLPHHIHFLRNMPGSKNCNPGRNNIDTRDTNIAAKNKIVTR
jgi:hypothetical protein